MLSLPQDNWQDTYFYTDSWWWTLDLGIILASWAEDFDLYLAAMSMICIVRCWLFEFARIGADAGQKTIETVPTRTRVWFDWQQLTTYILAAIRGNGPCWIWMNRGLADCCVRSMVLAVHDVREASSRWRFYDDQSTDNMPSTQSQYLSVRYKDWDFVVGT